MFICTSNLLTSMKSATRRSFSSLPCIRTLQTAVGKHHSHAHTHTCCTQTPTACPGAPLPRRHCEALSLQVDEISIHRLQGLQRGTHALQQPYFTLRLRNSASDSARGSAAPLVRTGVRLQAVLALASPIQFDYTTRPTPNPTGQSTVNLSPQD